MRAWCVDHFGQFVRTSLGGWLGVADALSRVRMRKTGLSRGEVIRGS
jgi:hypothetical protein